MYSSGRGSSRRSVNIWPGFVDALATLLLVVIFVLMVFMIAQFFLSRALTGRDEALERLNQEITELSELLALERAANADLRLNVAQLSSELQSSLAERESLGSRVSELESAREALADQLESAESSNASLRQQLAALLEDQEALEQRLSQAELTSQRTREELEQAYATIEADKEKIETQLAELAILKSLRDDMTEQLAQMESALAAQEESADALRGRISDLELQLGSRREEAEIMADQLAEARSRAQAMEEEAAEQEDLAVALQARNAETQKALQEQTRLTDEAQSKIDLLNRQIAALRQQLARISVALEEAEAKNKEKDVQIADLGRRLNVALATKVQDLARYRSEFFGRLREVLGEREDIRIVGDRFVFQSELFFETGEAELGDEGKEQLSQLADTLKEVASQIPDDLDWILRVDGHTDTRPIDTAQYPSNWELSTARALEVVHYLVSQGIPPERLAATGFGEFQPVAEGETQEAYRKNRRIEMRFTQR